GLVELALTRVSGAAVDEGCHIAGIGIEGGAMLGDSDGVQVVLDAADALAGVGQLCQAIEHETEVLRPTPDGPGRAVGEQLPPRLGQQNEVAAVGVGPAGQGEGAQFAETVDVGVWPDPYLPLGPTDNLDRGKGDGAGDAATQGCLRARSWIAGAGVNQ